MNKDVSERLIRELEAAEQARAQGNEGKARVCARRAGGMAASQYLYRGGIIPPGRGAYDHLRFLQTQPNLSSSIQDAIEHLLLRVNEDFQLPPGIDLIHDARFLIETLLFSEDE